MMYMFLHTHNNPAGNNCLFEYNNLSGLCYEVTDSGGFYTGRSWIERGNIIRHSQFSDIRTTEKTSLGSPSVQAIYLDDQVLVYRIQKSTLGYFNLTFDHLSCTRMLTKMALIS